MTRKHNPKRFPNDWTPSTAGPGPGRPKKGKEKTVYARLNMIKDADKKAELRLAVDEFSILKANTAEDIAAQRDKCARLVAEGIWTVPQGELCRRLLKDHEDAAIRWLTVDFPQMVIEQMERALSELKETVVKTLRDMLCQPCISKIRKALAWFQEYETK